MGNIAEFSIESGLKKIKCNEYGDFIIINTADAAVFEKFGNLYNRIVEITEQAREKTAEIQGKYGTENIKDMPVDGIVDYAKTNTGYLKEIISEFDFIFGSNCIRKVFRECYEYDEYFVPDQAALEEFLDKITPIMESCFGERLKKVQSKYNVNRRGGKK